MSDTRSNTTPSSEKISGCLPLPYESAGMTWQSSSNPPARTPQEDEDPNDDCDPSEGFPGDHDDSDSGGTDPSDSDGTDSDWDDSGDEISELGGDQSQDTW